ncbi:MAG: hypothetical protein SPL46_06530, partial [Selenomonadaceae bacterium]|nr:hypothetical protein [Selenomonadaceae bacterium]
MERSRSRKHDDQERQMREDGVLMHQYFFPSDYTKAARGHIGVSGPPFCLLYDYIGKRKKQIFTIVD